MNGGLAASAKVLVTDDQPEVLRLIERIIGDQFDCEFAHSVSEAREKLMEGTFDLALCDIEMPEGGGIRLAEELAATHPDTALMFITGVDDPRIAERASKLGAHGYLVKPFGRGQLLISTMNALRRRDLELAHRAHERSLEGRMQSIIDHAPMPIYAKDRDGRYVIANRPACEMAGIDPDELLGQGDEAIMPPESVEQAKESDRRVLESGESHEEVQTLVIGDEERITATVKFPLYEDDRSITAVCGISRDITAQREAARLQLELTDTQRRAIEELRSSRLQTVERLARAIELHHPGTGEHVDRMAIVAAFLANKLGMEAERVQLLRAAAPMHDVGKIGIPDGLLSKPGALTPEERKQMEKHTLIGSDLLGDSDNDLLQMASEVALTHHERFDGSGYPRGLAGKDIPIEGRVVAVADVFDALLSDRSYRPAMSVEEAERLIKEGRGSHFDPEIADLLLNNLEEALSLRG